LINLLDVWHYYPGDEASIIFFRWNEGERMALRVNHKIHQGKSPCGVHHKIKNKLRRFLSLFKVFLITQVCGGPRGGEGLLIGMKNGLIVKVWINSNFSIRLYKHTNGIRCLDLSSKRVRLAIVDEAANVVVYDIEVSTISYVSLQ
jgi:hypothetical protein